MDKEWAIVTTKQDQLQKTSGLVAGCLVVACLYFARAVFIPIALAVLLAFLLEPLAKFLERGHLNRTAAALAAVFLAVALICGLSYFVVGQFGDFAKELPKYEQTIHGKLRHVREGDGGVIRHLCREIAAACTLRSACLIDPHWFAYERFTPRSTRIFEYDRALAQPWAELRRSL